jgi:predicted esterase
MKESQGKIDDLIKTEIDGGVSPSRVITMGFSQGGFMAMLSGTYISPFMCPPPPPITAVIKIRTLFGLSPPPHPPPLPRNHILRTGLARPESEVPFGGIVAMSTAMFKHFAPTNTGKKTPMLFCHGDADDRVSLEKAEHSSETLKSLGVAVEFKVYPNLGHGARDDEMQHIEKWVMGRLA